MGSMQIMVAGMGKSLPGLEPVTGLKECPVALDLRNGPDSL